MRIQQLPKSHVSHFQTMQKVFLGQLWLMLAAVGGKMLKSTEYVATC